MPTTFTDMVLEESTKTFVISFYDETGAPVVPNAGLQWWLFDDDKESIVNNRNGVIISPAAEITLILSGDDLAILHRRPEGYETRYIVIRGTYDSDLGVGLPIVDYAEFRVLNIPG